MNSTASNTETADSLHHQLIDQLVAKRHIQSELVEAAFRAVRRQFFLPDVPLHQVYKDDAIITKRLSTGEGISSSSQPTIMAIMIEQLDLKPGHRVLEIGAGTGFNAALMAHIVGKTGQVVTIDLDEDTVANAQAHLAAANVDGVQAMCGDGVQGYSPLAPYDRIILAVGSWDIAPAWVAQLRSGGLLVLPLSIMPFEEMAVAFKKHKDHLASISIEAAGFMKLRGELAAKSEISYIDLGPEPGLSIAIRTSQSIDPADVFGWLTAKATDFDTGVTLSREKLKKVCRWITLHQSGCCQLVEQVAQEVAGIVPPLNEWPGKWRSSFGLINKQGLALLTIPPENAIYDNSHPEALFPLTVRQFGPDSAVAEQLIQQIQGWDAAGQPGYEFSQIKVYPASVDYTPDAGETTLDKTWSKLIIKRN